MTVNLETLSKRTVGKRIAANTGLMVGAKFLSVIMGLGTLLVATRALSLEAFGTIIFLHAYMLFFAEVATFQTWQAIIRFGADDLKAKDSESLSKLVKFGIKLDALSAVFAYLGSLALFGFVVWLISVFPALGPNGGTSVAELQKYAAIYCLVVLARQRTTAIGVMRLFDKFNILAIEALIMPALRLMGSIYAYYAGWGIKGFLAVWFLASLSNYLVLILTGAWELHSRKLLSRVLRIKSSFLKPRKGLWPFVIKSNIDSTLAAGTQHLPALLVMAFFGPVFTGIYRIAEEVAKLLSEGFKLLDQVIYPELAKMVVNGEADKIWRIVTRAGIILLSVGLVMSALVWIEGPRLLGYIFSKDYSASAPLASLLVPAAALTGLMAPLFPIFYASDKPELAIAARGYALFAYIGSFIVLSLTIGKMAPGWAAIIGNSVGVGLVFFMAKKTLRRTVERTCENPEELGKPLISLVGDTNARIWGMSVAKWQERAMKKAGGLVCDPEIATVHLGVNWILSSALARGFVATNKTALVIDDVIVGVSGVTISTARALIGQSPEKATAEGMAIKTPDNLADSYNKALRKTDPPYGVNVSRAPTEPLMRRQFESSYKGITDFVTKYFWPLPAYYVTRLCARLRFTPNMVTTIGLVLCIAAFYFFMQGQWVLGFITGWTMTFLDTVDGKLARTTMTYSKWGNAYDHGIDLIHPPFWYWAWFMGLGGTLVWTDPASWVSSWMGIALGAILIGYVVDRLVEGLFIAQHGFHIHVWRPFNSFLRVYIARRNPNTFIFMLGCIASIFVSDAARWGFYAVAIWTWACILINFGVVLIAAFSSKPVTSWMDDGV